MKCLKILALAAAVATALTVFASASASATVLCQTKANPCGALSVYPFGTQIHANLESLYSILEDTSGNTITGCSSSTIEGHIMSEGGETETVSLPLEVFTWGNAENPCTSTTSVLNTGSLEIHWISGTNNGTLTSSGLEVTVKNSLASCVYGSGSGTDIGTLTGGKVGELNGPAKIDVNTVLNKVSGSFICASDARWTATFKVSLPLSLFVEGKV